MQKSALSYFRVPLAALLLGVAAAFFLAGPAVAATVAILAVLEISLAFDNAVVNASILQNWTPSWRRIFLGLGLIIAVFGMRLVFPILIVSAAAGMAPGAVVDLVVHHPQTYAAKLHSVHPLVAGFGGAFLMMIGLSYFLDRDKDKHWISVIEKPLRRFGEWEAIQGALTMLAAFLTSRALPATEQLPYLTAGVLGFISYVASRALGAVLSGSRGEDGASRVIKAGVGGFLYLELLDASMSFDGVIAAFAIADNLIWIAVGLGIGALTVREMTLLCVDRGALADYPHLENGAYWAILVLAALMVVSPVRDVPDVATGLIGAALIGASFLTSVYAKRKTITEPAPAG